MTGLGGYCQAYEYACRVFEPARLLYFDIVERVMGYSRVREAEAAYAASMIGDWDAACGFLEWAEESVKERRVCVVGPLYDPAMGTEDCEAVLGVEQVYAVPVKCDVVSGDLDATIGGVVEELAIERYRIVHVHGDNYVRVLAWASSHKGDNVVYTSQAYCAWPVVGLGGFTDGDRLVLLAMGFGAREIFLLGFNLEDPKCIGKAYCDAESKRLKLDLSRRLLREYSQIYGYRVIGENTRVIGFIKKG